MAGTQTTLVRLMKLHRVVAELKKKSLGAALKESAGIGSGKPKRVTILGKAYVSKAKDALGHGSNKRGDEAMYASSQAKAFHDASKLPDQVDSKRMLEASRHYNDAAKHFRAGRRLEGMQSMNRAKGAYSGSSFKD